MPHSVLTEVEARRTLEEESRTSPGARVRKQLDGDRIERPDRAGKGLSAVVVLAAERRIGEGFLPEQPSDVGFKPGSLVSAQDQQRWTTRSLKVVAFPKHLAGEHCDPLGGLFQGNSPSLVGAF